MPVIGADIGTQSLKVVVADDDLTIIGEATTPYQPRFPRPGWAEQDTALWLDALAPTIGQALADAGLAPTDIAGLGIAGQLDGCVATDRDGRALGPALIWMDRRAEEDIEGVSAELARTRGGIVLDPTHMAAKIRWLLRNDAAARRAARFHQPVSFLVVRLTGEHVFDHGLASTTMLYGLARRDWDPDLVDAFGIDLALLPAIADAFSPAGRLTAEGARLTGLRPGTTVAVGTGDDFANPLGGGLVSPGRAVCTLGTAEVVGAVHDAPIVDGRALVETHGYVGPTYFLENPGWLSGGALTWFQNLCGIADPVALDRLAATSAPGANGVTFLPALSGAMAPEWIAGARGCFYGLTAGHGSADLARAVLEGCAFAMRDVIDRLVAMGVRSDALVLLGGGARSALWSAIRADVAARPVAVVARADTSPVGAALLASVSVGRHASVAEAARLVGQIVATVDPVAGRVSAYEQAYRRYRRLFDALRPMYG